MCTCLTSVSNSTDSARPARPDLTTPHVLTIPSPTAIFLTTPAVDPAVFDAVPDRHGTTSLKWDSTTERGCLEDILPLWVADMNHATTPTAISVPLWRTRHGILGYSEPDEVHRTALTSWFSRRYGWQAEAEWNTATPGVVLALALTARTLTAPDETVLIEEPVYYPFRDVIEVSEHAVAVVPLVRNADGVYRRNLAALEETIGVTGACLPLLCNPRNPASRARSREGLAALEEVMARHGVIVVADEIHANLALPDSATTPFASLGKAATVHTITCTSPLKSFDPAGLQITNIPISDAHPCRTFRHELATTGYSRPNTLGLTAYRAAYEDGDAWLDALHEHTAAARVHVEAHLERVGRIEAAPCEGIYLLWLDCSGFLKTAGLEPEQLDEVVLNEAGPWLDDGQIFGAGGEGFTRVDVVCSRTTFDTAPDRLGMAVAAVTARVTEQAGQESAALSA